MVDVKIELGQIEETDFPLLRGFLNSNYAQFLGFNEAYSLELINQKRGAIWGDLEAYGFSIKTQSPGDFKKTVCGFCAIRNINWVARHGEVLFIKTNSKGDITSIQDCDEAAKAFAMLIDYAFFELNMNKVWIEVYQGLNIKNKLESYGFVAEGVREFAKQMGGKQISTTIYSLLADQYRLSE